MRLEDFRIGSVIGDVSLGSRWRGRIVPLSAGDVVKCGYVEIVDDEGMPVPAGTKQLVGICIDPESFFLVEPPCSWASGIPVFGVSDLAVIREGGLGREEHFLSAG